MRSRAAITACAAIATVYGCTGRGPVDSGDSPPNVLFIAIDDMNDWVGGLDGYAGTVHTPNLERLAAQGMLFTNAHTAAVSCNPSRTALLTGRRPSTSGVYANSTIWREQPGMENVVTLPAHFRANGYRTMGSGKIFHALSWLNGSYGRDHNDTGAWDEFWPSPDQQMPDTRFPAGAEKSFDEDGFWQWRWDRVAAGRGAGNRQAPPYYMDWGGMPDSESELFADEKVTGWAVEQIANATDEPFFLAVGIFRPHIPWFIPQSYLDLYPLDDVVLPEVRPDWRDGLPESGQRMGQARRGWHHWIVENDEWDRAVQAYLASIGFADAQVGRLIDALEASGKADRTIIVLWSDHGFQLGERETWEKFTLWEESTRVPFIIVAPGVTTAGSTFEAPVDLMSVYPTLVELAGLPTPASGLEGGSLVPWLTDPTLARETPAISTESWGNHAVRTQRWRYIRYRDGSEELYDHDADPEERVNRAADPAHAATLAGLAGWLEAILATEAARGAPGG